MEEKLLNIKKALEIADVLLTEYCQIYDVFVEKQEDIDKVEDLEKKQELQNIRDMSDTIELAFKDLEDLKYNCRTLITYKLKGENYESNN